MKAISLYLPVVSLLLLPAGPCRMDAAAGANGLQRSLLTKHANIIATVRIERDIQLVSKHRVLYESKQGAEVVATVLRADDLAVLSGLNLDMATMANVSSTAPAPEDDAMIQTRVVKEKVEVRFQQGSRKSSTTGSRRLYLPLTRKYTRLAARRVK